MISVGTHREDPVWVEMAECRGGPSPGTSTRHPRTSALGLHRWKCRSTQPALCLCRYLVAAVGEGGRATDPVAARRPIGQVRERLGEPQLDPVLVEVPAEREVAPRLALARLGGQQQRFALRAFFLSGLAQTRLVEVVICSGEEPSTWTDRDPAIFDALVHALTHHAEEISKGLGTALLW